jgi:hypothetical protein
VAGTIVNARRSGPSGFAMATHPIWWIMTGCGAIVMLLGWLSNTPWSHASVKRVASLLQESAA